jgi:hypothetical protein
MSFNLKEYILYRTEIKRELFNAEVDNNFKMVANPWAEERTYEEGNIVYHPVVVEPAIGVQPTGGGTQSLAWWRANKRTTKGVFLLNEWDLIGGVGTGDLSVQGADGFGKILVNYNGPTGSFQGGPNGLITSPNPNATINYIAGPGMQLQWDQSSNSIKFINVTAGGEVNNGINIGTGNAVYAGMSGTNLQFRGFSASNTSGNPALSSSINVFTNNINYNLDSGQIFLGELSGGNPTADELSDITYPSGLPTNGDLLQWNSSSGSWIPVSLSLLGVPNIYDNSSTIANATRTVTLNGTLGGNLKFQSSVGTSGLRIENAGTGFVIGTDLSTSPTSLLDLRPSDSNGYQFMIDQKIGGEDAVISVGNEVSTPGETFLFGYDASVQSFGIIAGPGFSGFSSLQGPGVDYLTLQQNGTLSIPYLGSPPASSLGNEHFLTFAENATQGLNAKGVIGTELDGGLSWTKDGTNGKTTTAKQFSINYGNNVPRGIAGYKAGLWVRNVAASIDTHEYAIYSQVIQKSAAGSIEVTGIHSDLFEEQSPFGTPITITSQVNRYEVGSIKLISGFETLVKESECSFSIGALLGSESTTVTDQWGLASYWIDTATPLSKIGVFSDTVNVYSSKFDLNENSETWSGLFKGCFAIKQGGLVLDTFSSTPSCNITPTGEIPYEDRTLWINEGNGHLYRGNVDLESSISGSFKTVLASSSFRISSDSNNFASDPYVVGFPTEFSIGGDHSVGAPVDFPGSWDSNIWNECYNVTVDATPGSLSSIDSNGTGCLIPIPYPLTIGQKLKLTCLVRLAYNAYQVGTVFKQAVMYLDQNNFFDITGNSTSIELLGSDSYLPDFNNSPVAIFNTDLDITLTQNLTPGDCLLVGFGLNDYNSSATPSNRLTVSWTLSASNS